MSSPHVVPDKLQVLPLEAEDAVPAEASEDADPLTSSQPVEDLNPSSDDTDEWDATQPDATQPVEKDDAFAPPSGSSSQDHDEGLPFPRSVGLDHCGMTHGPLGEGLVITLGPVPVEPDSRRNRVLAIGVVGSPQPEGNDANRKMRTLITEAETPPKNVPFSRWAISKDDEVCEYYEHKNLELFDRGGSCVVYRTTEKDSKKQVAIKRICFSESTWKSSQFKWEETTNLEYLQNSNVAGVSNFIKYFRDEKKYIIDIVMELESGGDLYSRIVEHDAYGEAAGKHIARQICATIAKLHSLPFVHRDIKPGNILLSDNSEMPTVKLADFGAAKSQVAAMNSLHGTAGYIAPEITKPPYSNAVDAWSYGMTMAFLFLGEETFSEIHSGKTSAESISGTICMHMETKGISSDAQDFVRKFLQKEPSDRMTFEQALEHPWLANTAEPLSDSRAVLSDRTNSPNATQSKGPLSSSKGSVNHDGLASNAPAKSTKRAYQSLGGDADGAERGSKKTRRGRGGTVSLA